MTRANLNRYSNEDVLILTYLYVCELNAEQAIDMPDFILHAAAEKKWISMAHDDGSETFSVKFTNLGYKEVGAFEETMREHWKVDAEDSNADFTE